MQRILGLAILLLFVTVSWASAAEKWVFNISPDGSVVTFYDGSTYEVNPGDFWKSYRWLKGDEVRSPDSEWLNARVTDEFDGSTVHATRIR